MILLLLGLARADTAPQDLQAAEGVRLLQAGQARPALDLFWGILARDPSRLDAREGVVRGLEAIGDYDAAARAAGERLAYTPDDPEWQHRRLRLLGMVEAHRAEAIEGYRAFLAQHPDDGAATGELATYLSWTPGALPEAVETWRRAEKLLPEARWVRMGLARTLAWSGALRESARRLDTLIAEDPKDPEARLARIDVALWTNDRATAARLLKDMPDDPRVLAARSRLDVARGRVGRARSEATEAARLGPNAPEPREAAAVVHRAIAPRVAVRSRWTQETTGVTRYEVAVPVELHPLADTRLRLAPSWTRFNADLDRVSLGAEVRQGGLPAGLYGLAGYRLHVRLDGVLDHEAGLELGAERPGDLPFDVRIGARQRPIADTPLGYEDLAVLDPVGSGGALLTGIEQDLQVREAWGAITAAPLPGGYLYATGAVGAVGENGRRTLAAGAGFDVLSLLARRSSHTLTVKYDLYALGVDDSDVRYFSPTSFAVHTPGLAWRTDARRLTLGLEGGVPLRADAPAGWLAGAVVGVRIREALEIGLRGRTMNDTAWRADGLALVFEGRW
jgi:thioredoxin-like negative regulator of GroEL